MISGADLPEDLSPWGMFENSDLVVKAVVKRQHRRGSLVRRPDRCFGRVPRTEAP
jgi:hypothetical protein